MAEIHVEKKRGINGWVWFLILAILIVAAVAFLWQAGYINLALTESHSNSFALIHPGGSNGA